MSTGLEVTLSHLSEDGKQAGTQLTEARWSGISARELRKLLRNLSELAPKVEYPAEPTVRIRAESGQFLIQVKAGRMTFVSWNSGQNFPVTPPVDEIVRIVTGEIVEGQFESDAEPAAEPTQPSSKRRRLVIGIALAAVVVGLNAFTLMQTRKPPGNFLVAHRLLDPEPSNRLLESVAGAYETGGQPGDRRLEIARNGATRWITYGPDRAAADRKEFTVRGAETSGSPALLTSRQTLIKVKDAITITYFGDTYTRVTK